MRVVMTIDGVETYPPYCPFSVTNSRHSGICGHPNMDLGRQSLYCGYTDCDGAWQDAPVRCPLLKGGKDVRVEGKI